MTADPARQPSPIRGISRNVFLLGLVSLCTDASTEMIYPLIPLFLTATLHAPVSVLGLIEGLAEATASLLKGFSGWFSDRIGRRRPLVLAGYGLAALTKPLLALAAGWPLVLGARVLDRFGKGLRGTPRDALIADSSEENLRGRAFGFHRSTDQAGAVIGPLLALPLLALFHQNFRAVFVAAFLPAAIGVAFLTAVRETGRGPGAGRAGGAGLRPAHPTPAPASGADLRPAHRPPTSPVFRRFLVVMLLFALGNSSDTFLLLRARQLGFSTRDIVLVFAAYNATYVLSAWPAGILSDRIGRRRVMAAGLVIFALVYSGFGIAAGPAAIWAAFLVYGLYQGLTDGTARAFVVDLVGPERRATALGIYSTALGLAAFPASLIAGLLWQHLGPPAAFFYGSLTAALAALAFALTV